MSSGSLAAGTRNYTHTYNALGQRVGSGYSYLKGTSSLNPVQAGDVTAYNKKYYYDAFGRLTLETNTKTLYGEGTQSSEIVYLYDDSSVIGIEYTALDETNTYYFRRNLQGDVVGIYDTSGNFKVKYLYDAWGNCTVASETTDLALAKANPIRYRGYYYDEDTGLYFLNARYYSPEWRRFISPDDTAYLDSETPNGLNLYSYCGNDPVNFADPSGNRPEWYNILGLIGVGLVVAAATVLTLGAFGVAVGGAGLLGAVIHGAAVGALIGAGAGTALGAAGGMIYDAAVGNAFGTSVWKGVQAGFGIGAIVGFAVGGAIGYTSFAQPGVAFNPKYHSNLIQKGINPHSVKYGRQGFEHRKVIRNLFETIKKGKIENAITVSRDGIVSQGNHRLLMARLFKITIDVMIGGMSK